MEPLDVSIIIVDLHPLLKQKLSMVEIKKYCFLPTKRMPNSRLPLIHYPGLLSNKSEYTPSNVYNTLSGNGWQPSWLVRYGPTQWSHYHSTVHECMVVLSGTATIRFGIADIDSKDRHDSLDREKPKRLEISDEPYADQEEGGMEITAQAGDVFVLPAGLAHKTFNPVPCLGFKLLAPNDIHHVVEAEMQEALAKLELSGFTMLGAYPRDGDDWDFAIGGENEGRYEDVWSVAKPRYDPILGQSEEGICGQWK